MKKGVIMDEDERFLTLLTPEGEFLKARKQKRDYLIGEEIDFSPFIEVQKKKSSFFEFLPGKALPAAACVLVVGIASFIPFYNSDDVYAYMSIDVNPSIELAVNDDLRVVEIDAYNVEGEHIISEIKDWKHQEVSIVTNEIIEEIKDQGFFENHDKVVISTVYENKKEIKVDEKLEANIDQIEEKIAKENLQLTVVNGTKKERKEAQKQGVTTGIYKEKHIIEEKKDKKEEKKLPSSLEKQNKSEFKENKSKLKEVQKVNKQESKEEKKKDNKQEKREIDNSTNASEKQKKSSENLNEKKKKDKIESESHVKKTKKDHPDKKDKHKEKLDNKDKNKYEQKKHKNED